MPLHLLQVRVTSAHPQFCSSLKLCATQAAQCAPYSHEMCDFIAPMQALSHLLHTPSAMLEGCTYCCPTLEATTSFSLFPTRCACSFYDFDAPIYTMSRFLPPSKVADAEISDSILGDGTVIRAGCNIKHSVIGLRTLINENCTVEDALVSHAIENIYMLMVQDRVLQCCPSSQQQWLADCLMAACSASSCLHAECSLRSMLPAGDGL